MNNDMKEDSIRVYKEFKESIKNWPFNDVINANIYINKNLNNQLKRIKNLGLRVETTNNYDIEIYENPTNDKQRAYFNDIFLSYLNNTNGIFVNQAYITTGMKISKYYNSNNQLLKTIKYPNRLFINVTSVNDYDNVLEDDYKCPNCGNVCKIKELLEGCKYCRTKFTMNDFYPRVTNYYHCNIEKEKVPFKKIYFIVLLITMVLSFLLKSSIVKLSDMDPRYYEIISKDVLNNIVVILFALLISLFISIGVIIIRTFVLGVDYYSGKATKKSTYINLENFIRQGDPNFTYYLFEGKMISMLKDVMFASKPNKLNIFQSNRSVDFSNIVDSDFYELYINNSYVNDNKLFVEIEYEMYDTLFVNGKIVRKTQKYCATVCRNANVTTSSKFRLDYVKCNTCGASIDATNDNHCKFCNNAYDFKEYDFVFVDLYRK